jgi:hypothetical protein
VQSHIAQTQALVVLANAALQSRGVRAPRWEDEPSVRHCGAVEFFAAPEAIATGQPTGPTRYAADPDEWLQRLRDEDVIGLRLQHVSPAQAGLAEHEAVAFAGGGGAWTIEAVKPLHSELWSSRWEIAERDRPDGRIWRVRYLRAPGGVGRLPAPSSRGDLPTTHAAMRSVLQRLAAFAEREGGLDGFAACFRRALAALEAPSPLDADPTQPTGRVDSGGWTRQPAWFVLPTAALQLVVACDHAWVFGGMGSWNDVGFDGDAQREYEALSGELWRVLTQALLVTAEASFDPTGRGRARAPDTSRFIVSQEPGNISTIDYGRLHGVAYDREIHARHEGDGGSVRLRIERCAGPLLVTLRPPERDHLRALGLPARSVDPPWCADAASDAASDAALSVEPAEPLARGAGEAAGEAEGGRAWRVRYGVFEASVPREALAIGTAGLAAFLVIDRLAEPVELVLAPELVLLDAGVRAYPWPRTRDSDDAAIGPELAVDREATAGRDGTPDPSAAPEPPRSADRRAAADQAAPPPAGPDAPETSVFERIGSSAARHREEGWTVARTGRYTVRYEAGARGVEAEVEPGVGPDGRPDLVLHRGSLAGWMQPHQHEPLADDARERIARRMADALGFLGVRVVLR